MGCDYCEAASGKYSQIVFEDENFVAFIAESAIAEGQVSLVPKKHLTILELIPENLFLPFSNAVKLISAAQFESLQCHGTNVLIENGIAAGQKVPHFAVQLIPRYQDDGISLEWEGKKLSDFDMEDALLQIQATLEQKKTAKPSSVEQGALKESSKEKEEEEENYLIKSLNRIP